MAANSIFLLHVTSQSLTGFLIPSPSRFLKQSVDATFPKHEDKGEADLILGLLMGFLFSLFGSERQ